MPFVRVADEQLYYRDIGSGEPPIIILHGGWGYEFYPFDDAIARLPRRFVIPDRTGYGKSPPRSELPPGFHKMYAEETEAVLDALGITRCVLWGHSDGAVIAAVMALRDPRRYAGIILEAIHLDREKPRSREFFRRMAEDPDAFGERVTAKLATEHGESWRTIIRADGRAWLHIAATPDDDCYDHRLGQLAVPTLVLHGAGDPRTERGELAKLPAIAEVHLIESGQHSPHSERATASICTDIVERFLGVLPSG